MWSLAGNVLENCSCDLVCPGHFSFRNRCTHDYCHAVWAFRTSLGRMREVDLEDLGLVLVGDTPPYMIDGNWKVAIYIDDKASDEQARCLERIFTGQAGGPWAVLDRFVGTRFPTKRVSIRFEEGAAGRLKSVEITDVLRAEAEPIRGHDRKKDAKLVNLFNTLYEPIHIMARGSFEYRDHGLHWKRGDHRNHALLTTFDWAVEKSS